MHLNNHVVVCVEQHQSHQALIPIHAFAHARAAGLQQAQIHGVHTRLLQLVDKDSDLTLADLGLLQLHVLVQHLSYAFPRQRLHRQMCQ